MGSDVIVLSGSKFSRIHKAFLLIAAIAKTQWEVKGESFVVWLKDDDTRTSVEQLIDRFQLQKKLPGETTEKRSLALQILPTPQGQWPLFNHTPSAKRGESASYLGEPIPTEALFREEKRRYTLRESPRKIRRKSSRPFDPTLRKNLQELGLEETAQKYGVSPATVRSWARKVPGASKLIPDGRGRSQKQQSTTA